MRNAIVTGASGFIGRYVARELAGLGFRVVGVGSRPWDEAPQRWGVGAWHLAAISGDALERVAATDGCPDVIVHLAGGSAVGPSLSAPFVDFQRSVVPTAELLEWVRSRSPATEVIYASSAAVYGGMHAGPVFIGATLAPTSPYGVHKMMGEQLCRSYAESFGVRVSVVRLFSVYGRGLRKQLLWDLCCRLRAAPNSLELGGTGTELRDWVHVEDAAKMLVASIGSQRACRTRNGGTGRGTTVARIAALVRDAWGSHAQIVFNGQTRRGDPACLVAGVSDEDAGVCPPHTSLERGIADYVSWYRSVEL